MKDNHKRDAAQIKILAVSKAVPTNSDRDTSPRVPLKNKSRTGVLLVSKKHGNNNPKNKVSQSYCVLYNNYGMSERKYKSHSSENCFGSRYIQESTKEGLGGSLINRNGDVNQFHNSERKWKRDLKSLKKKNSL